ncbi:30S ribosomal protein S9 [Candidatus Woesearchaeota archaeon]|nr:30S ribosomal protein S9 [Candidatus Woesearchaeota archaeon]
MAAKKPIVVSGRRKTAIAQASVHPGTGIVRIDGIRLDCYEPMLSRMKIMEPMLLAGGMASGVNIDIHVAGGGISGRADAARLALARALVQHVGAKSPLRQIYLDYDRNMLVADIRVKEMCKPNDSKARKKRQKSYR